MSSTDTLSKPCALIRRCGGGHACASGATLKNRYGIRKVLADADELIARYKAENTDWM